MEKIKVGVIAGTPYDTELGVDYFNNNGLNVIGEKIANDPEKQNYLQYTAPEKLMKITLKKIEILKNKDVKYIIIYCNSLSAVLDKEKLERQSNITIITPLDIYRDLVIDVNRIGILAANSQSAAKIEKMFMVKNPELKYVSAGVLPIVNYIERKIDPADIIKKFGLYELIMSFKKMKVDKLVLGCTHFPYFEEELLTIFPEVINPAQEIINKIQKLNSRG